MAFEKYTQGMGGKPVVHISAKGRQCRFNTPALTRYAMQHKQYLEWHYDRETDTLAIAMLGEKTSGTTKLCLLQNRGTTNSLSVFQYFGLLHTLPATYELSTNADGWILIDLTKPKRKSCELLGGGE